MDGKMIDARLKRAVLSHYRRNGRTMPWRRTRDPYRILVSEIMLQQTQVARVMKFYPEFITKFPDFRALARAPIISVLHAWQGLGYNRRALALRKLARRVLHEYSGRLPRERAALESLPGIGKATAGSLRAFIWNEPEIFIETNIRRVFIHFYFPMRAKVTDAELLRYIQRTLPSGSMKRRGARGDGVREWYWALMDYGAMLGTRAVRAKNASAANPNRRSAHYRPQSKFKGSDRELRGRLLRASLAAGKRRIALRTLAREWGESEARVRRVRESLVKEGFMKI